jgi:nucleoside-diphosphate-sugar epimerase
MENVIVTGGSGLLGATIVHELVKDGKYKPVIMDIVDDPKRLNDIKEKVEYVQGDISNPELLNETFAKYKPVKIFHLAVFPGDLCEKDHMNAVKINVNGFMHLMEAARNNGVQQVLFSSSGTTYGEDLEPGEMLTDKTLQRPASFYGINKVFAESVGRWYRKKYDFDFRAIHYPAIVGPGLRAAGMVTYASAMIEIPAKGEPYVIPIGKDIRLSIVYVEDGARALIQLGEAPKENIKTINYFINGVQNPLPSSGEMAEMVKKHIPNADITFEVNEDWDKLLESASHPVDDSSAVTEWNWTPKYNTWDKIIDKYLDDLK